MQSVTRKCYRVAIAGNPNSGKTSIFNAIAGAFAHVGNYPGVTVEKRSAIVKWDGMDIELVDLPGVYSFSAYTLDEQVARDYILKEKPDVVINVIDCGNLERNLYLTTQLMDMGVKLVVDLNMWDEAEHAGISIDEGRFSARLGAPVVKTVGHKRIGINNLVAETVKILRDNASYQPNSVSAYPVKVNREILELAGVVASTSANGLPPYWYAVNLLEDTVELKEFAEVPKPEEHAIFNKIKESHDRILAQFDTDPQTLIIEGRFKFVTDLIEKNVRKADGDRMALSNRIDQILTHKLLGYPIFLGFMWLLFQATFVLGQYPANWINHGVSLLSSVGKLLLPAGIMTDLVTDGIIGGVGSVMVFLPNIMILFLGIAFLEDSGYMARAAFLMDRLMRSFGLHGKSFIPLLMGFGCNVPAIMATRTLESRRDRILATMLIPFMSCSARLSVFILLCGAFFANAAGNVIFLLYLLGIVIAVLFALVLRRGLVKAESMPFIMEFPPYRRPTFRTGLMHMWMRGKIYLKKMGGFIMLAAIIIWFLGAFPRVTHFSQNYDDQVANLSRSQDAVSTQAIETLKAQKAAEQLHHSFIGRIGTMIEPTFNTIGFTWQMGVSLLAGFIAKEVVVSTMGVLYQVGTNTNEKSIGLISALRNPASHITPLTAFAYMVFVLLYTPCVTTVITIKREVGVKWMWFSIASQLAIAWTVAFAVYRIGLLMGLG